MMQWDRLRGPIRLASAFAAGVLGLLLLAALPFVGRAPWANALYIIVLLLVMAIGLVRLAQAAFWLLGNMWSLRGNWLALAIVSAIGALGIALLFWIVPRAAGYSGQITFVLCSLLVLAIAYRISHPRS